MWAGPNTSIPYADFDKARQLLSEAPGVNQMGKITNTPGLVYEQTTVAPNSSTPHRESRVQLLGQLRPRRSQ